MFLLLEQGDMKDRAAALFGKTNVVINISFSEGRPCLLQPDYEVVVEENLLPHGPLLNLWLANVSVSHVTLEGQYSYMFEVSADGQLHCLQQMDYELVSEIILIVSLPDQDTACSNESVIVVRVNDVNDHSPIVLPTVVDATVTENIPNLLIENLTATDSDGSPEFSTIGGFRVETLTSGSLLPFRVNILGQVWLTRPLDAETDPRSFSFSVYALDSYGLQSKPVTITIHIENINDNDPRFERRSFDVQVNDSIPAGSTILKAVAYDDDIGVYGELTFSLSTSEFPFIVNFTDGTVTTTRPFNIETEELTVFMFDIIATDGGGVSTSVPVTVEVIDVASTMLLFTQSSYNICISEGLSLGSTVLTLDVVDGKWKE